METTLATNNTVTAVAAETAASSNNAFITANTIEGVLGDIQDNHIIPVFLKDNEPLISQADFIGVTQTVIRELYHGEQINQPAIRLSHPIKGRIPDAKDKPAAQLESWEKTIYYERMAFVIEVPSIQENIQGNDISLTIGGVKAYNLDNLYSKNGADQHFKIFIGFQNKVCTNLMVWTDGCMSSLTVKNRGQLQACIKTLIQNYNAVYHVHSLKKLAEYYLTEQQFAILLGRCRMYPHLSGKDKQDIPPLPICDTQLNLVCKDYFRDKRFCRDEEGNINLWRLYNLFTSANKTTYIDSFLDRAVNAFHFVDTLRASSENQSSCWYLE